MDDVDDVMPVISLLNDEKKSRPEPAIRPLFPPWLTNELVLPCWFGGCCWFRWCCCCCGDCRYWCACCCCCDICCCCPGKQLPAAIDSVDELAEFCGWWPFIMMPFLAAASLAVLVRSPIVDLPTYVRSSNVFFPAPAACLDASSACLDASSAAFFACRVSCAWRAVEFCIE